MRTAMVAAAVRFSMPSLLKDYGPPEQMRPCRE